MMRTYELMLIVRSDFSVDDEKKRNSLIEKLVKGAKIIDVTVVGKKHLAYPITKQTDGIYVLSHLQGNSIKNSDIDREAKLNDDVIRFLLIQKEG